MERERIAKERTTAEAEFALREQGCQTRFAVTSCVEGARRERREMLTRLRHQEAAIDEAQRKQRAAQRVAAIRAKVSSEEARQPKPATREHGDSSRQLAATVTGKARHGPAASPASPAASEPDRGAQESASKAAFEARKQAAQVHREAVLRQNAQRSVKQKKAALPVPPSASAP